MNHHKTFQQLPLGLFSRNDTPYLGKLPVQYADSLYQSAGHDKVRRPLYNHIPGNRTLMRTTLTRCSRLRRPIT